MKKTFQSIKFFTIKPFFLSVGKPLKRLGFGTGHDLPTFKIVGYVWKISTEKIKTNFLTAC